MEDEWSDETTIFFLELYQSEPVIWDPKHLAHKDKKKIYDAWGRISEVMGNIPIAILKRKKESLMSTFRSHLRRYKASLKSGAGADEIYTPVWKFYNIMVNFLSSVYECNLSINTETQGSDNTQDLDSELAENNENQNTNSTNFTSTSQTNQTVRRRKNPPELVAAEKQMNAAFNTLNSVLNNKQPPEDDCDIYAKLLAKRLKKLPERQKEYFMFKIDELWWQIRSTSDDQSQQVCPENAIPGPSRFSLSTHARSSQSSYKKYVPRPPTTPSPSVQEHRSSSALSTHSQASYTGQVPNLSPSCQSSVSSDTSSFHISHDAYINAHNPGPVLIINKEHANAPDLYARVPTSPENSYILSIPECLPSYHSSPHTQSTSQPLPPSKKIKVISDISVTSRYNNLINDAYEAALSDSNDIN